MVESHTSRAWFKMAAPAVLLQETELKSFETVEEEGDRSSREPETEDEEGRGEDELCLLEQQPVRSY